MTAFARSTARAAQTSCAVRRFLDVRLPRAGAGRPLDRVHGNWRAGQTAEIWVRVVDPETSDQRLDLRGDTDHHAVILDLVEELEHALRPAEIWRIAFDTSLLDGPASRADPAGFPSPPPGVGALATMTRALLEAPAPFPLVGLHVEFGKGGRFASAKLIETAPVGPWFEPALAAAFDAIQWDLEGLATLTLRGPKSLGPWSAHERAEAMRVTEALSARWKGR